VGAAVCKAVMYPSSAARGARRLADLLTSAAGAVLPVRLVLFNSPLRRRPDLGHLALLRSVPAPQLQQARVMFRSQLEHR
jgi:hypothetical protein